MSALLPTSEDIENRETHLSDYENQRELSFYRDGRREQHLATRRATLEEMLGKFNTIPRDDALAAWLTQQIAEAT